MSERRPDIQNCQVQAFGSIISDMKGTTFGARDANDGQKSEAVRLAVYDGTAWLGTSQNLSANDCRADYGRWSGN
jgi:hypothetical protein